MATRKTSPTWNDLKIKLADFDRAGLLGLVQDMYSTSKDNQNFLHARFDLGDAPLKPYKAAIDRWLWPDVFKNQGTSVAKAKKSISDFRKAVGQAEGLAELMVFYCERASGFSHEFGLQDEGYFDALVRMFEQALKTSHGLPAPQREPLLDRLNDVRLVCRNFAYGVGDDMDALMTKHEVND